MQDDIYLYITGNYKKIDETIRKTVPLNVIFTGYLAEQEFIDMLFSVDAVMVLTTADHCMLCGCYEAVSAEKPLITSDKKVLKDYFKGAIFVENTPDCIAAGLRQVIDQLEFYRKNMLKLKHGKLIEWENNFISLEKEISSFRKKVFSSI